MLGVLLGLMVVASACSGAGAKDPAAPTRAAAPTPAATVSGSDGSRSASPASPVLDQAWATAELTDAARGETFRLADFAGRTVIIETMAIWCTNCKRQQEAVYEGLARLETDAVTYVLLDVDPSETAAALVAYRESNGFDGIYAVAGDEVARALAAEFGDQVLNPPATPMIVIDRNGAVTLTEYGHHRSPDEVVALAQEHGA